MYSLWSSCFRPVSRTEAEVLLERHPDCGNMLLRPGRDGTSLAVTTRQDLNGYDLGLKHLYPYLYLGIYFRQHFYFYAETFPHRVSFTMLLFHVFFFCLTVLYSVTLSVTLTYCFLLFECSTAPCSDTIGLPRSLREVTSLMWKTRYVRV